MFINIYMCDMYMCVCVGSCTVNGIILMGTFSELDFLNIASIENGLQGVDEDGVGRQVWQGAVGLGGEICGMWRPRAQVLEVMAGLTDQRIEKDVQPKGPRSLGGQRGLRGVEVLEHGEWG